MKNLALDLGFGGIEIDTWLAPSAGAGAFDTFSLDGADPSTMLVSRGRRSSEYDQFTLRSVIDPAWTLLAGHRALDILVPRNLSQLYFDPLMRKLDGLNGAGNGRAANGSWVGVYPDDSNAELLLIIDMVGPLKLPQHTS